MTARRKARDDQAGEVWAAMRDLVEGYPTKQRMRDALDLGRGSGRIKSLLWLAQGPRSLSGLAEAIGVDAPYATLIVDSLEARGLVERQPDPGDRRRKLVTLTAAGQEAVSRVQAIQRRPPPGFDVLTPAELDTLEGLMRRVTGAAGGPGDAVPSQRTAAGRTAGRQRSGDAAP
jgi:DNA-binding MarR family transcriptional regulator